MSYISISFEIHYQFVLDAACVFAVFLPVAAIFVVMRKYRVTKSPSYAYRKFNADPIYYRDRKPIPEENQNSFCCEVCENSAVE